MNHYFAPRAAVYLPQPVTRLQFDPLYELLWCGNSQGRMESLIVDNDAPTGLPLYTRFRAHMHQPVRAMLIKEHGVISLSATGIHCCKRGGGIVKWQHSPHLNKCDEFQDLYCLSVGQGQSEIVVAGNQSTMHTLHAEHGQLLRQGDAEDGIMCMKRGKYLVCGTIHGHLLMKDSRSLKTEHTIYHQQTSGNNSSGGGQIIDMDLVGNVVAVCSLGPAMTASQTVKLFDIRTMKHMDSITLPTMDAAPSYLAFHPKETGTLLMLSQSCQLSSTTLAEPSKIHTQTLDTLGQMCVGLSVSSSGDLVAVSDTAGCIRVLESGRFANSDLTPVVNKSSLPVELATPITPADRVTVSDTDPLNKIGMPYYDELLLSSVWPAKYTVTVGVAPVPVDPGIIENMKMIDFVGYAPNLLHGKRHRNQVQFASSSGGLSRSHGKRSVSEPKFRHEKERDSLLLRSGHNDTFSSDSLSLSAGMPDHYRKVEIKYSRFGVEDFDFGFFNQTRFGGLETHIANSYCNALLQTMFFTEPLRKIVTHHVVSDYCKKEFCLSCEIAFLMRMLEDANGLNCHASNFLRAFGTIPQGVSRNFIFLTSVVEALGLLEPPQPSPTTPYTQIIQSFNRFIYEKLNQECSAPHSQSNPVCVKDDQWCDVKTSMVQQVFGVRLKSSSQCTVCHHEVVREQGPFSVDLVYPRKSSMSSPSKNETRTFSDVMENSFLRSSETKAWCDKCQNYMLIRQTKKLQNLPTVLSINAGVLSEDELKIWRSRDTYFKFQDVTLANCSKSFTSFLPLRLKIGISESSVCVEEMNPFNPTVNETKKAMKSMEQSAMYELTSVICQVEGNGQDPNHLLSLIRVPFADSKNSPILLDSISSLESIAAEASNDYPWRWYLFNDFVVREVTPHEAVQFRSKWKVPAVLQFTRVDAPQRIKYSVFKSNFNQSVLTELDEKFYEGMYRYSSTQSLVEPLAADELGDASGRPMLIALDAEFVALSREEMEVHSDGTRSLIRPVRMHLARVSVVRGDGALEGVSFIDDYISTSEPIVDYLTEFSGIHPDDLDPVRSRHSVIPLKSAYKKLRVLVDMGCVFVGHGLNKDFRTINILVPRENIVDTVDLYRLEGQRKISLRFLAWYALGRDIQMDSHDSIEDACMALHLYKRYLQLEQQGVVQEFLRALYNEGRKLNWKPPHWRKNESTLLSGGAGLSGIRTGQGEIYSPLMSATSFPPLSKAPATPQTPTGSSKHFK